MQVKQIWKNEFEIWRPVINEITFLPLQMQKYILNYYFFIYIICRSVNISHNLLIVVDRIRFNKVSIVQVIKKVMRGVSPLDMTQDILHNRWIYLII